MDEIQIAEFWSQVDVRGPDECWEWIGRRWLKGPYGRYKHRFKAHRVAYQIAKKRKPGKRFVRHTCDNPPCCNPAHLRIGTPGQNMKDKRVRLRSAQLWGESHGMARLSDAECESVRARAAAGESVASIHRESFAHVSYGSVWSIARGLVRTNGSGVTKRSESDVFWKDEKRVVKTRRWRKRLPDEVYEAILRRSASGETPAKIAREVHPEATYSLVHHVISKARKRAPVMHFECGEVR